MYLKVVFKVKTRKNSNYLCRIFSFLFYLHSLQTFARTLYFTAFLFPASFPSSTLQYQSSLALVTLHFKAAFLLDPRLTLTGTPPPSFSSLFPAKVLWGRASALAATSHVLPGIPVGPAPPWHWPCNMDDSRGHFEFCIFVSELHYLSPWDFFFPLSSFQTAQSPDFLPASMGTYFYLIFLGTPLTNFLLFIWFYTKFLFWNLFYF